MTRSRYRALPPGASTGLESTIHPQDGALRIRQAVEVQHPPRSACPTAPEMVSGPVAAGRAPEEVPHGSDTELPNHDSFLSSQSLAVPAPVTLRCLPLPR
jgi:hypothetical protein